MRLERVASAAAILLVVLATAPPPAFAAGPPTATIVSPFAGATIAERSTVTIHYAGYSAGAKNISGYFTLDGVPAGTFTRAVGSTNSTTFNATLNGTAFASGAHQLGARVFTELDDPVDAPSVPIVLNKPPSVALLAWSYDLDARDLVVDAHVADDGTTTPAVRLSSGGQSVNDSFVGNRTLRLDAPRGPGSYGASLTATDALNQTARRDFTFTVLDREATLSVSHAAYEMGGKLRVRGNVSDADGNVTLQVTTALGSGPATLGNGTEYSALVDVTPSLGTFNGTVRSTDAWGGTTETPFTFTIGGPNATVFSRVITTELGGYADRTAVALPPLSGAAIEICVDGCGGGNASGSTALYDAVCGGASWNGTICRQLTGRPGQAGAFDLCAPQPPSNNLVGQALHNAANAANNATGGGVCSSLFDEANVTLRALGLTGIGVAPGVAIQADVVGPNGTAARCTAFDDRTCLFEARAGATLDLSWLQGPEHTVSVRIVGVRV